MKSNFSPTFHRDNTITIWDVHTQQWVRTSTPTKAQMCSMDYALRERTVRHCRMSGMDVRIITRKVGINHGREAVITTLRGEVVWTGPLRPSEMRDTAKRDGESKAESMGWVVQA